MRSIAPSAGQLKPQFDSLPSGHTWRWETRRILGWNLPLYVVVNLALGHPVDVEMTAWQAMFLPRAPRWNTCGRRA